MDSGSGAVWLDFAAVTSEGKPERNWVTGFLQTLKGKQKIASTGYASRPDLVTID
jgi:hypothetical protein